MWKTGALGDFRWKRNLKTYTVMLIDLVSFNELFSNVLIMLFFFFSVKSRNNFWLLILVPSEAEVGHRKANGLAAAWVAWPPPA